MNLTNPATDAGVAEVIDITQINDAQRRLVVLALSGETLASGFVAEIEARLGRPLQPILDSLRESSPVAAPRRPGLRRASACPFACGS